MADTTVVEAVGTAVKSRNRKRLGVLLQAAMQQAILEANAEGISTEEKNSPEIRRRMQDARERILKAFGETHR